MIHHVLTAGVPLHYGYILPTHVQYLRDWREQAIVRADAGDVAASICNQAALIELVLFGELRHDWLGIMDEFLTDDTTPLAYSEAFGRRLHRFADQYRQPTVHAIHTRWWIERLHHEASVDHDRFADLILAKKQSDGLIYDRDTSETILRHRMRSELTMSMAMSAEILEAAGRLTGTIPVELATNLTSPSKCPAEGYMSAEYFRLSALRLLGYEHLFPVGIEERIEACAEGLTHGWCDFAMGTKVDAYMGTAKRTDRDRPIHSPVVACYVSALLSKVEDTERHTVFVGRLDSYAGHLKIRPWDIPAFQMRDVPIPFGADRTPLEVICASFMVSRCQNS